MLPWMILRLTTYTSISFRICPNCPLRFQDRRVIQVVHCVAALGYAGIPPLPGFKSLPAPARVLFALSLAVVLAVSAPPASTRSSWARISWSGFSLTSLQGEHRTRLNAGVEALRSVGKSFCSGRFLLCFDHRSVQRIGFWHSPFAIQPCGQPPPFPSPLYAELIRALMAGLLRSPSGLCFELPRRQESSSGSRPIVWRLE